VFLEGETKYRRRWRNFKKEKRKKGTELTYSAISSVLEEASK
jgi:hypothetical protein